MSFLFRHVGNLKKPKELKEMLKVCDLESISELITKTNIIKNFNIEKNFIPALSEQDSQNNLKKIMKKNKDHTSYIGLGYYNTITPSVIKRHLVENPNWYTAYTPYQAEISQGRLESQYNYQTVVKELTGMPVANASLLDESSAAGEAVNLSYTFNKKKRDRFLADSNIHPQTLDVLETRAKTLGINMETIDFSEVNDLSLFDPEQLCNIIFQYPNTYGDVYIPENFIDFAKKNKILTTGITDLLALTKIITPGELGLNIALGSSQRFGIPLWYGGPHPAFFAVSKELLRLTPGRIIGKSKDSLNNDTFRLALQTREQHIKRQNATSNICTSQSLLTNVVSFYSIYNGKEGIVRISKKINNKAKYFVNNLNENILVNKVFYDTVSIKVDDSEKLVNHLKKHDILVRKIDNKKVGITFSETINKKNIDKLISSIKDYKSKYIRKDFPYKKFPDDLRRKTDFFTDSLFSKYRTETNLLRYMTELVKKDYSLTYGMIPLGSCTMKLNATYQLEPLLWDKVTQVHPFVPKEYAMGYQELIDETGFFLKRITGFNHISFQPNSGATGEYTGLLCIKKYHEMNNHSKRTVCLIPDSAHGTNFASASVANLKVKTFDDKLLNNIGEFEKFVEEVGEELCCLMITYPNTNGVFQKNIEKVNNVIHKNGGLVYMDGANMNALTCIFSADKVGFDVAHLNLHKTFCIPHGGGGPGLGPILCNSKLKNYLPSNSIQLGKNDLSCGYVSSSNWSSASLLTIPYLYISSMGTDGLKKATKMAILNSNYLKNSLKNDYNIIDVNENGVVGHEFIIDISDIKKLGITENDIAKRLMDYSFHPPTMSWPRSGVLMFEPTESESKEELDRLIIAMKSIKKEINDIKNGKFKKENNLLKNAPHCFEMTLNWNYPYCIKDAFYPLEYLKQKKFNIPVGRVDDVYGDRILLTK